ncbi:MAG: hypothetical protein MHM6MM_006478 [Cercozoa sp. M6MM]
MHWLPATDTLHFMLLTVATFVKDTVGEHDRAGVPTGRPSRHLPALAAVVANNTCASSNSRLNQQRLQIRHNVMRWCAASVTLSARDGSAWCRLKYVPHESCLRDWHSLLTAAEVQALREVAISSSMQHTLPLIWHSTLLHSIKSLVSCTSCRAVRGLEEAKKEGVLSASEVRGILKRVNVVQQASERFAEGRVVSMPMSLVQATLIATVVRVAVMFFVSIHNPPVPVPVFLTLEYFFLIGLLKVATNMLAGFGADTGDAPLLRMLRAEVSHAASIGNVVVGDEAGSGP